MPEEVDMSTYKDQVCAIRRKKRRSTGVGVTPIITKSANKMNEDQARLLNHKSQTKVIKAVQEVHEARVREREANLKDLCSMPPKKNCCCKVTGTFNKKWSHQPPRHFKGPLLSDRSNSVSQLSSSSPMDSNSVEAEFLKMTQKLRALPPPPPKSAGCMKNSSDEDQVDLDELPWAKKASCRKLSKVDMIMNSFPQVKGTLPPVAFPAWRNGGLPLTHKVPRIQALMRRYLTWTRGNICQELQKDFHLYTIEDPWRSPGPYNALNDRGTKTYFDTPHVRCLIHEQRFINDYDEVVCTMKDFNEYREYIRLQTKDKVHQVLKSADDQEKHDREQLRSIKQQLKLEESGDKNYLLNSKAAHNRECRNNSQKFFIWKTKADLKYKEDSIIRLQRKRKIDIYLRLLHSDTDINSTKHRFETARTAENSYRETLLAELLSREMGADFRSRVIKAETNVSNRNKWISSVLEKNYRKMEEFTQAEQIRSAVADQMKENVEKRKKYYENQQKQIFAGAARKKSEDERILRLTRKYFNIWLSNTRRNIKRRQETDDGLHQTVWTRDMENGFESWVAKLKEIRDYRGSDFREFVWHVLKIKLDPPITLDEGRVGDDSKNIPGETSDDD